MAKFNMKDLLNNQSKEETKEVDSTKINVPIITAGEVIKISSERTPNIIALEINRIKEQTVEVVLKYSVEIGRRLVEAKQLLNHGEWGNWLEQSVSCSKSTANNFMRLFEEYGAEQISILGDNLKSQTFGNLTYSKALALLAIPSNDREGFIEENEIDSMSTRELKRVIKEKQELEDKLKVANAEADEQRNSYEIVSDSFNSMVETNNKNVEQSEKLKRELEKIKNKSKEDLLNREVEIENLKIHISEIKKQNLESNAPATGNKELQELEEKLRKVNVEIHEAETIRLLREIAMSFEDFNNVAGIDIKKVCLDAVVLLSNMRERKK